MELTNEIYLAEPLENGVRPEIQKEVLQILTLLLAPMTPHIAEEMWEMLGNKDCLWNAKWPVLADAQLDLAKDNEVEIPVQVNGKVRTTLKVATGASEAEIVAEGTSRSRRSPPHRRQAHCEANLRPQQTPKPGGQMTPQLFPCRGAACCAPITEAADTKHANRPLLFPHPQESRRNFGSEEGLWPSCFCTT